ncbi:hypothetical protein BHE74_00034831 [Ensete ventricosum]|nr:hypothetical protein BHE74_00034831 [Ensete ventricosum]
MLTILHEDGAYPHSGCVCSNNKHLAMIWYGRDRGLEGYSSTRSRWHIFLYNERDDVHASLSPMNDPSPFLISPLEGLNFLMGLGHRSEVIIKEVFKHHDPILGKSWKSLEIFVYAPDVDEDDDGLLLEKPFDLQFLQVGVVG